MTMRQRAVIGVALVDVHRRRKRGRCDGKRDGNMQETPTTCLRHEPLLWASGDSVNPTRGLH